MDDKPFCPIMSSFGTEGESQNIFLCWWDEEDEDVKSWPVLDNNKACLSIQITSISNIIIITIITTIHAINISSSFPVEEENSFFCFYLRRKLNIACPLYLKVKHVINKMYEACTRWDKRFITLYAVLSWIWLSKTDMYPSMCVTQSSCLQIKNG